jgi:MFS family permease
MKQKIHPAWIVAGITFGTLFATAGFRSAPSVLILPLEEEFGWRRDVISAAIAINVLLYGLTAPFAAALMDRFTVRKVVMGALTVIGIGAFLTIWMSQSWHLMLLWGVVVGVGTGSMALVFAATIANRWFVKRRGLVIGVLTAAGASGQLVFLPSLARLAQDPGWRASSLMVSIGAFLMVPLIYFFLKEDPQSVNSKPYGAADDWQPPVLQKGNAAKNAIQALKDASKVRNFWYLVGSFFICGLSTSGLIGTHFIPAAHDHGMPATTAASLLAIIGIFDLIGTVGSGYLTDKVSSMWLLVFFYGMRGLALLTIPVVLGPHVNPPLIFFIVFYGLDWIATVPPTVQLCREYFGVARSGVVYGWVFAFHMIGAAIAASFAGWIRETNGDYEIAWYTAAILCLIAAACMFLLKKIPTLAQAEKANLSSH